VCREEKTVIFAGEGAYVLIILEFTQVPDTAEDGLTCKMSAVEELFKRSNHLNLPKTHRSVAYSE
jgi:hypothetical protein